MCSHMEDVKLISLSDIPNIIPALLCHGENFLELQPHLFLHIIISTPDSNNNIYSVQKAIG